MVLASMADPIAKKNVVHRSMANTSHNSIRADGAMRPLAIFICVLASTL